MLIYSLLHLTGYDLSMDEIKRFRQLHSKTPGHPENVLTPGVEITTGPLGQGFANGVGMGIAEAHLAAKFNQKGYDVVDNYIYCICSDGDLMEGVSYEAASLAGHLKLGNLIYLYDDNEITIDGSTDLAFTEDRTKRFEAAGWHVLDVADGNDLKAIEKRMQEIVRRNEEIRREVWDRDDAIAFFLDKGETFKAEIIRAAQRLHSDLIVLGSRERHGLAILLNFTEDTILHAAPCDVLAVRLH